MDHQQLFGLTGHAFIGPLEDARKFVRHLHPGDYVSPCTLCEAHRDDARRDGGVAEVCAQCPPDGVYVPEALAPVFRIWRAAQHDT